MKATPQQILDKAGKAETADPRFIEEQMKAAKELLHTIGLIETTSLRQRRNGTIEFSDPQNMPVKYTLHANGYYRKHIKGYYGNSNCYQINRTQEIYKPYTSIRRILIPGQYLLMASRIVRIVRNSRIRNNEPHYYTNILFKF